MACAGHIQGTIGELLGLSWVLLGGHIILALFLMEMPIDIYPSPPFPSSRGPANLVILAHPPISCLSFF